MVRAVIDLGSTGIRLIVAQDVEFKEKKQNSQKKFNILDRAEQRVNLGRDVFTSKAISRETLIECVRVLLRYKEQLLSWGITPEETNVIATSAVREAVNRDPFIDRIKVRTGFTVKVIDGIEENRLMYVAVNECLTEENSLSKNADSMILDITGGSTELMLIEKGRMAGAHSMPLGTVIIEQKIRSVSGTIEDAPRFIQEFIRNAKKTLSAELNVEKIDQFIALGNDMKIAATFAGKSKGPFVWEIKRNNFEEFVEQVQHYSIEECIAKFKLNYFDAQMFIISLLAHRLFVNLTNVDSIIVPDTSIREGLLLTMALNKSLMEEEFFNQVIAGSYSLLKKYQGDVKHADCVRKLSLQIFDELQNEIGLDRHARLLLEVSAILHDIGMFIRAEDHNIHGKYIINHSEIFGLSRDDKSIVAKIVGFHAGSKMPQDDREFQILPRTSRMVILKLSAVLRVADALDRTHSQKIKKLKIHFSQETITFRTSNHYDLSLERLALETKGDLFENIFGYNLVLG